MGKSCGVGLFTGPLMPRDPPSATNRRPELSESIRSMDQEMRRGRQRTKCTTPLVWNSVWLHRFPWWADKQMRCYTNHRDKALASRQPEHAKQRRFQHVNQPLLFLAYTARQVSQRQTRYTLRHIHHYSNKDTGHFQVSCTQDP